MPGEKRAFGLPRLLIAGVALAPEKSNSSAYMERVPATALAAAIANYNANHNVPILRVGSIPENLCLKVPERSEASRAVKQAFANLPIQAREEPVLNFHQRA